MIFLAKTNHLLSPKFECCWTSLLIYKINWRCIKSKFFSLRLRQHSLVRAHLKLLTQYKNVFYHAKMILCFYHQPFQIKYCTHIH